MTISHQLMIHQLQVINYSHQLQAKLQTASKVHRYFSHNTKGKLAIRNYKIYFIHNLRHENLTHPSDKAFPAFVNGFIRF